MKGFVYLGLAVAVLVFAGNVRAATYTLADFGAVTNLPDKNEDVMAGINNRGCVAQTYMTNNLWRARLYNGAWTNLGTLGGTASYAEGLNDYNQVAGYSLTAGGASRAFLWTPGGTNGVAGNPQMRDLGTLGGGVSEAYDINESGVVVGFAQTAAPAEHAVCWNGTVLTDVGALLPDTYPYSYGYGINNLGQVVGTAYDKNYKNQQAFLYDGTTANVLGGFGGSSGGSEAFAINDSGSVAGYVVFGGSVYHAFRYRTNFVTDLGALEQGTFSKANAINNSHVVVGTSTVDANGNITHAFIATGDTMADLNNLVDSSGAGWTLVEATDINDSGQIVGVGTSNGQPRGFLLTPIAPRITALKIRGSDGLISFTTITNATYFVDSRTNLLAGSWSNVLGNIPGNGGIVTRTNFGGATAAARYYRVRVTVP